MTQRTRVTSDDVMTAEQKAKMDRISEGELKEIDRNILENASREWSKVTRLVLATMIEREEGVTGLPEQLYLERIAKLVSGGSLESRGDLGGLRGAEVRLTEKK